MKNINILICSFLLAFGLQNVNAQCTNTCRVDFQNDGITNDGEGFFSDASYTDVNLTESGTQIADGNTPTASYSFDIFDSASGDCTLGTDGSDDLSITLTVEPVYDVYGGGVGSPGTGGAGRSFFIDGVGIKTITDFTSGEFVSTTGDVYCYTYEVTFGNPLQAQDAVARVTSINTAGQIFESASVVFLDGAGVPYGSATYNGFWNGAPGGSNGGTNGCSGTNSINIEADIYTTTGTGVVFAADPGSITTSAAPNTGTYCFPENGTSGSNNNYTVDATTDAGLMATDIVSGFVYTVCLEDVATTCGGDDLPTNGTTGNGQSTSDCNDPDGTAATNTAFTNTLSYVEVCNDAPCGYTADVAFTEVCGQFTIDVTNIIASGTTDDAVDGNVEYSIDGGTNWIAYTAGTQLPADGSALLVQLVDPSDISCTSEVFNGNAPIGTTPNTPVFVPNGTTTTAP